MSAADLRVEEASEADTTAILAINLEGRPGVVGLDTAQIRTFLERATLFRVARLRDRVVGYLIAIDSKADYEGEEYLWFRKRPGSFLYVDQVAVAREARQCGVASAIYREIEEVAARRGLAAITCEVNLEPANPISLRFHGGRGFSEVGTLRTKDGRLVSLLEKRLASPGLS
ncbi:MAG TPA: GNAT family N-acetyltransferase [Candidatus Polarisedimenticolia bacterium]|nr:GNAT family N-acetyltransferase [Candidatus Polarisedimenticolia bacterium]